MIETVTGVAGEQIGNPLLSDGRNSRVRGRYVLPPEAGSSEPLDSGPSPLDPSAPATQAGTPQVTVTGACLLLQYRIPLLDLRRLCGEQLVGRVEDLDFVDFVALGDRVHDVLPLGHFAEDGMLAIEVRRRHVG